jgi:ABC-2 type transport system permease protein
MNALDRRASTLELLGRWIVARFLVLRRTPRAFFFTFVFPLILFLLVGATNSGMLKVGPGLKVDAAQYLAPSIACFSLLTACYTTVILTVSLAREQGILKRIRGTPLNPGIFIAAQLVASVAAGIAAVSLMLVVAVLGFGVHVYANRLPAAVVTLAMGGLALGSVGLFISTFVKKADSAPAIANLTMFPFMFLSGIFFPITTFPDWLKTLVGIFPVRHLVDAFVGCFSPFTSGSGFSGKDLGVMALWFAVALALAVWRFRREVEAEETGGTKRARGILARARG